MASWKRNWRSLELLGLAAMAFLAGSVVYARELAAAINGKPISWFSWGETLGGLALVLAFLALVFWRTDKQTSGNVPPSKSQI